jgi:hypothetical protein
VRQLLGTGCARAICLLNASRIPREPAPALVMLIKLSTPHKILPEIEPFRPRVIKTSLSKEQEVSSAPHLVPPPHTLDGRYGVLGHLSVRGSQKHVERSADQGR